MIEIPYLHTMLTITCLRILIRVVFWIREKRIVLRRELQLLLVYICIVVVTRFTFFPFSRVDASATFDIAAQYCPYAVT